MTSYKFQKREKRIDVRNRANYNTTLPKIWNDYTEESENQTPEDIFKSFLKLKNILSSDKVSKSIEYDDYIKSDSEKESESQWSKSDSQGESRKMSEDYNIIIEEGNNNFEYRKKNELIGKKTHREIITEETPSINPLFNFEIENPLDSVGPIPIKVELDKKEERKFYAGSGLKREEAELFAHYVKEGKRIPRRGEVGMTTEDIEKFESLGYVMSGVRNSRMNKARVKKEQMLYTVEEKKALALYNMEEKQRRERNIINEMKIMWKTKQDDDLDEETQEGGS